MKPPPVIYRGKHADFFVPAAYGMDEITAFCADEGLRLLKAEREGVFWRVRVMRPRDGR